MSEIIVVGAGVIGASVGYRLARAGARVTILEAGRVGGETSGSSFAWTNSRRKLPRAYHDLNVAGMRAHAALRDEFGSLPWWHGGGNVEWFAEPAAQRAQQQDVERLQSWGYPAEWITPARLAELEPELDLDAVGDAPIAYYPEDGWLDAVPYAHAMLDAARRAGAALRTGARVEQVHSAGSRVDGVTLGGGERLAADVLVNCAGRLAGEVAAMAGLRLPLAPTTGLLVLTPPVPTCLGRIVHAPGVQMRPDGAGRLLIQAADADAALALDAAPRSDLPIARELVSRAARVLPGLAGVDPEAVRIGVRPIPADGLPAVGPEPGLDGYYVVVTHSGVTLSPFLGQAVAGEIVGGRSEPRLVPFRPGRFGEQAVPVVART